MSEKKLVWVRCRGDCMSVDLAETLEPRRIELCQHGLTPLPAIQWEQHGLVALAAPMCPVAYHGLDAQPCVFETLYAVPADSQPQPPSVTT